jgi:uncharacterized OB-fold protein
LRNVAIVGTGITQFGRRNDAGIMFDVNHKELKIGDRVAWETIRIRGPEDKVRYWCCLKKV